MNTDPAAGLREMVQQARDLARAGRAQDAVLAWRRILGVDSTHVEALVALGSDALGKADAASALPHFQRAARVATRDPMIELYVALAHRQLGNVAEESDAIGRALAIDPHFYPALLHRGTLLERLGKRRQAARVFRDVLKIMPERERLAPSFRRAVDHAQAAVQENQDSLARFLEERLSPLRNRHGGTRLGRFEETVEVLVGHRKRYSPEPVMLHFAQLPPLQFYDDELFPWLAELEAATESIRDECIAALSTQQAEFNPYIQYPPDAPLNQWRELNHSPRWTTYFLWKNGGRVEANCEHCPRTAAIADSLPLARIPNFAPNVLYSALEPRTVIPPHTGDTNARLIVHLPLILPPGCTFRVGNDTRPWRYGKAWVFDDSIEHEARNDSDETRVQLMLDVWNPYLSPAERELVAGLLNTVRDYYQADA